ncbi:MAG: TonB-dependent receptor [Paracoccus denitrificans]|nr:MAG: TonB-dependent receptor [Paracoccus denitrificans]PZO84982.1 MAG: TonB-dependent receptor [Paracoccus denitrificans]
MPQNTPQRRRAFANSTARIALASALAFSTAPTALLAQNVEDPSAAQNIVLDTVVITAAGFEQLLKDAPASVTVVTADELEKGNATSLTDMLKDVQGVTATGNPNEQDIQIRGMPGQYTLILVDGKRQNTRDSRTNGSGGYEQSLIPPVSAIERIEVVRGPMSSLYGSDAMGGVINIITKKVADVWSGEATASTTLQEDDDFGNSRQLSFYSSGPLVADKLGLQLWGRVLRQDRAGTEDGLNSADEKDLTARLTWTPDDAQTIRFEGGSTRIEREPYAQESYSKNNRDHLSLSHDGQWAWGTTEVSLQREWAERTNFTDAEGENPRSPEIRNTVLDAKATLQAGANNEHKISIGGQYLNAQLTDQNPGYRTGLDEKFSVDQWSLFIEDEWQLRDDFALTTGLRYNDHENYKGNFTPRLYGVWSATDAWTVKGGVSTGFRAPDIRSITPNYAYTTGGGRCSVTNTCGVILADPDLKAEKSTSIELSAMYDQGPLQFSATAFQTKFKDKIENYRTDQLWDGPQYIGSDGQPHRYFVWYNRNVSSARIRGVELTASYDVNDDLRVRGNYTYTKSEQETGDYKGFPLSRTPKHMASLRADWTTPVEGLDLWGAANYHGTEINAGMRVGPNGRPITINGVEGRKYDAYTTVDLGLNYELNENAVLNFAVYNAFDKRVEVEDANTVLEGRRLWLGLTGKF